MVMPTLCAASGWPDPTMALFADEDAPQSAVLCLVLVIVFLAGIVRVLIGPSKQYDTEHREPVNLPLLVLILLGFLSLIVLMLLLAKANRIGIGGL